MKYICDPIEGKCWNSSCLHKIPHEHFKACDDWSGCGICKEVKEKSIKEKEKENMLKNETDIQSLTRWCCDFEKRIGELEDNQYLNLKDQYDNIEKSIMTRVDKVIELEFNERIKSLLEKKETAWRKEFRAPKSMKPIYPEKEWRDVDPEEIIQEGFEYWSPMSQEWNKTQFIGNQVNLSLGGIVEKYRAPKDTKAIYPPTSKSNTIRIMANRLIR